MRSLLLNTVILIFLTTAVIAQEEMHNGKFVVVNGQVLEIMVDDTGDTLYIAKDLEDVSVSSPRSFKDKGEYARYLKFRRYAVKVYPYAKEAIRIFRETEEMASSLNKRKKRRLMRKLQKELKKDFEKPLKHLTKLQGYILVKMIEKELDTPMFTLVKSLRGGFVANYWNLFSKMYGYHLKDGYQPGKDKILDAVLNDFDISYTPPTED